MCVVLWIAVLTGPQAAAAPKPPGAEQQLIAQQNRELDPQANDVDPVTGQSRCTPLPPLPHHGHDRTGAATASDPDEHDDIGHFPWR
ncbi:hypothetical protein [Blastococcus brunescens]|uniref:Secreted protein n=1 Tax=Blastococcus brunescens TaxID=1564165 RepID=A0ABZ1B4U6_9ACTN|nr:hypothetical protein [Blastococcus sp. BMG 8361]WRL64853.1 hypothetical protein U6N30_03670 [Blastococcus sp. BMG 8361]